MKPDVTNILTDPYIYENDQTYIKIGTGELDHKGTYTINLVAIEPISNLTNDEVLF